MSLRYEGKPTTLQGMSDRKRTHPCFGGALAVIATAGLVSLLGSCTSSSNGGDKPSGDRTSSPNPSMSRAAVPPQPARTSPTPGTQDGIFLFRDVNASLNFGSGRDPSHHLTWPQQGMWLMVSMYVKNIGNGPATYYAAYQRLIDKDGREFSADAYAMRVYSDRDYAVRALINPGEEAPVALLFDVPKTTQPMQMVLHELMPSPGLAFSFSNVIDAEPPTPAAEPPNQAANPPAPHPPQIRPTLPPAPQLPRMPFVIGPPAKHG
jgi:hypothetical protein